MCMFGWKIDVNEAKKADGVKVLTIPSPGRREPGMNWVIDSVPLIPPTRGAAAENRGATDDEDLGLTRLFE